MSLGTLITTQFRNTQEFLDAYKDWRDRFNAFDDTLCYRQKKEFLPFWLCCETHRSFLLELAMLKACARYYEDRYECYSQKAILTKDWMERFLEVTGLKFPLEVL